MTVVVTMVLTILLTNGGGNVDDNCVGENVDDNGGDEVSVTVVAQELTLVAKCHPEPQLDLTLSPQVLWA